MELESVGLGGAAAFREVRVQSVVVEFLLTHVDVLFSDTFTSAGLDPAGMPILSHVLTTTPPSSGLQWEGRWAPSPIPIPLKLDLPSGSLRTPPRPLPPLPPPFSFQLLRSGSPLLGPDIVLPSPLVAPGGTWGHGSTWEEVGGPQTSPCPGPTQTPCPAPDPSPVRTQHVGGPRGPR